MSSAISENPFLKEFLLSKIIDANVVNNIADYCVPAFASGYTYKVIRTDTIRGKLRTRILYIIITKRTKKQVAYKYVPQPCIMMTCKGYQESCDNLPVKCSPCKKRLADKTFRKKVFMDGNIEYFKCDIFGISRDGDKVFSTNYVK